MRIIPKYRLSRSARRENMAASRRDHAYGECKGDAMKIAPMVMSPHRAAVCLSSGDGLTLNDAAGVVLTATKGRLWLTMEGDGRDIDLPRGVTYTIERNGLTLVNAVEPSIVGLRIPHTRRAAWRGWIVRFWGWLVRMAENRARGRLARGRYR